MKWKLFSLTLFSMLCMAASAEAQWIDRTLNYDGINREYRIYLPEAYETDETMPLIIGLHGFGGTMEDFENTGIDAIADTARFIVLAPQALNYESPAGVLTGVWNAGIVLTVPGFGELALNENVNDVGFINLLIDSLSESYPLMDERIYLAGVSLGGFMTQRIACETPQRFAAIASIMGTYANALPPCNPTKVLPLAHFHGTDDDVVTWSGNFIYNGMPLPVGLPVDSLIAQWVDLHDCQQDPVHTAWPNGNNDNFWIDHYSYQNGAQESKVELFKLNGGGHNWYNLQNTGGEIDLATEVWRFFNRQYYGPTAIRETENKWMEVNVYPNPVRDQLLIKTSATLVRAAIIDITGRNLHTINGNPKELNTANLSPGNYWLQLTNSEGARFVFPFAKW